MSKQVDLVLHNCILATADGEFPGVGVAIERGKIVAVAREDALPAAARTLDLNGAWLLPGIIDSHVHFRDPGLTHKEDFLTGSAAAAAGGVTCVLEMPNTVPPTIDAPSLRVKQDTAYGRSWVDYGFYGLVVQDNIDRLRSLAIAGVVGFKCFLGQTEVGPMPPDDGSLLLALREIAGTGLRLAVHAENHGIMLGNITRLKTAHRGDMAAHLEARPPLVETEAIHRIALFARETGAKLHICHLSSREALALVNQLRASGLDLTTEVAAHYCFLTAQELESRGNIARVNPPIRSAEHGEALVAGLCAGQIDLIASDHAPHSTTEKTMGDVWQTSAGIIGAELSARLFLSELVNSGRLSMSSFVRATSYRPARIWGLYPRKGSCHIGADADFTVVDLNRDWEIREEVLHSKHSLTPFRNRKGRGLPVATIVRGELVMQDGGLIGEPHGEMVRPIRLHDRG